jgi:hypothetical protein
MSVAAAPNVGVNASEREDQACGKRHLPCPWHEERQRQQARDAGPISIDMPQ